MKTKTLFTTFLKYFLLGFICLAISVFMLESLGLEVRSYFGVKKADIERTIFEESQSYVHGKKQEAGRLFREYNRASTDEAKQIILNTTAHQMENFDHERHLSGELKAFVKMAKTGKR
jgi:hypothetical protein